MSKITFRADDDLVEQLEQLDASKSEAMREALRSYLEGSDEAAGGEDRPESDRVQAGVIDELIRTRVDDRLRELGIDRVDSRARDPTPSPDPQDVNVSISLEGAAVQSGEQNSQSSGQRQTGARDPTPNDGETAGARERAETQSPDGRDSGRQCNQCGDRLDGEHMYCPNCGEKASRRLFCECGDEVRSDWSFCPSCGRRTPAADVLESDSTQF
ncbi:CopG family transcriptional regulator [Natrinema sp. CBA1119]|uniref:double zinc ribbon domain-containing protein n=1 Tax=Natrinema sp. CBA1119 TaxID=1608465 RepID=UPI000BF34E2C|nr:zinc ribbon domain-containing protein [Natrinema sp. CBA1119]PGF16736.1 CopG family transcriptional regulator [Natrinema sp. CBA1119]